MVRTARLFFSAILSLILFFFVLRVPSYAQSYALSNTDPVVPNTLHNYTQNVLLEVFSAVGCQIAGIDLSSPKEPCLGLNPQTGKIGYVQTGGLIGMTSSMIGALYTPPAHLGDYTRYMASNFGIARQSYAQGVGYQSISPLVEIWKIFRNIVYLLFVLIFVFIGFAVMLRFKIDPRTVMSIENQLPRLIIGLLLVTFSFAIAGFLIDVMWILTFLVINILAPHTYGHSLAEINGSLFQNPFGFANNVLPGGIGGVAAGAGGSASDIFRSLFTADNSTRLGLTPPSSSNAHVCDNVWGPANAACWVVQNVADKIDIGAIVPNILAFIVSWLIGILGTLVVLIALLVAMFRVWFTLLLAYIYILLDVVLGPFYIIFGAIPGSKISFGAWVRDMLANLVSFPTVIAVLLLGNLFMTSFVAQGGAQGQSEAVFVPPLIGNPLGGPGNGVNTTNPLGWLIGLAIVLITPAIVNTMKELFKAPQNKLGATVFQGLGVGGKAVGGLAKNVFGAFTGNDIRYGQGGKIETIDSVPGRAWNRVKKAFGGG